ncbi:MAG: glycosyltransferase family 4 protein [Planctomycetota bacterium]|nr:glycosyltransferase family 4 protein [Planctomycetota bacterium]
MERYQHGICTEHARLGWSVEAWVQSRTEITRSEPMALATGSAMQWPNTKEPAASAVGSGADVENRLNAPAASAVDSGADVENRLNAPAASAVGSGGIAHYDAIAYASPTESRNAKLSKLRAIAKPRFAKRDFVFVSHHASVSGSLTDLLRDVPHVVHFHGPWADEAAMEGTPFWKTFLQRRQERRAYHSADRIITLSEAFKKIVVERYGVSAEIVRVVPGGIDSEAADPKISRAEARERMGWPTDRPIVLAMRRLVRRVGVDVFVEAIGLLLKGAQHNDAQKRFSDALFLIGGSGPLRDELTKRIQELGLQEHVRLTGFIPDELLSTAYRAADFTIVPTQSLEGFGLVTIESMAAGTPVVVTPIGSLPEVMNPLDPNLVFAGPSALAIADGLHGFLSGDVKMPSDEACRQYVRSNYDWSVIAPKVLDVYREASL